MFPILSPVGKVLGFGGRIVPGARPMPDGGEPAKYINTAETPVYHKAEVLYGLKQAKTAIRAAEEAVLVEGYADVVSLHQAGVPNVVAASGTALTAPQVRLVKSYARTLVLLYDADTAGQSAAARGIETVLDGGLGVSLVTLPDGADPDSFVRQFGAEAFTAYLEKERQDFPAFLAAAARRSGLLDTPEGKAEAASRMADAVARVGSDIARDAYLLRASEELKIPEAQLRPLLRESLRGRRSDGAPRRAAPERTPAEAAAPPGPPPPPPVVMRPEEGDLLRLMLLHGPPMVEHVLSRMAIEEFSEGAVRDIAAALIAQYEAGAVDAEAFQRGDFGEEVQRLAAQVTAEQHAISERGAAKRGKEPERRDAHPFVGATEAMRQLKLDRLEEALAEVKDQIHAADEAGFDATPLRAQLQTLQNLRVQIHEKRFLDWNEG
jgi:DNA primase